MVNTRILPVDAGGEAVPNDGQVPETPTGDEKPGSSLAARIHRLLEEPDSGRWARVISVFIFVVIMISIMCFLLETHPDLRGLQMWSILEVLSTIIFTAEFGLRFACCNAEGVKGRMSHGKFLRNPMNILDALAILPWYLEQILDKLVSNLGGLRVLRSVRLIRLFRILKLGKYSTGMHLIVAALRNALQPLSILSFFLCIGVILFSSMMFFAEKISCPDVQEIIDKGEWEAYVADCEAGAAAGSIGWQKEGGKFCCDEYASSLDFPSITATFWWAVVTMTTVGYGDQVPRTGLGRAVGCFAMICGILLISLPVAIVGSKFQEVYEDMEGSKAAEEDQVRTEFAEALENAKKVGAQRLLKLKVGVELVKSANASMKLLGAAAAAAKNKEAEKKKEDDAKAGEEAKKKKALQKNHVFKSIPRLRTKLRELNEMPEVSDSARRQIRGIFALFEQVDRIEREAQSLRIPDMALQATVKREFHALMKVCEMREGGLKKKGKDNKEV
eukprot:gnl/MRDRNA2_/MRDRNA2_92335_c0_seq1.p1 gnl/MRDRNA2_/MRDRNA2_92335_c0~~gnl/MRDRNA2_/MRDRNA2_92335_c0_seq1.p1  ORF type:complete len:502 (-),score=103.72 gnl/MRDRNA2_/MRDRNA2_92335_c0_seq1:60-1565(-)